MSTTNFANDPGSIDGGSDDSSDAKQKAQQAAGTAADEGKRVAAVAQDEVKNVASEASTQLRGLLDEATTQVDEQSKAQKGRLAETVRTFGDDLHSMKPQDGDGGGLAAQLVDQVAERAHGLASHLEDREPRELLDDVRTFARQRPGTFLLGALAAGLVVGRLTRGAKASQDSEPVGRTEPTLDTKPVLDAKPVDSEPNLDATPAFDAKAVEISEAGVPAPHGGRA